MKQQYKLIILMTLIIFIYILLTLSCDDDSVSSGECYTLTLDTVGLGTVTKEPDSSCYHTGTFIEIIAYPDTGYLFDRWTGDIVRYDNPYQFSLASDIFLTAIFTIGYTLTIEVIPENSGNVVIEPLWELYPEGDTVIIEAFPNSGYIFSNWCYQYEDSLFYDNPAYIVFNQDSLIIEARFASDTTANY